MDSEPSTGPDLLQSYGSDRERAQSLQEEYKADEEVDGLGRPIIRRVKSQPTKAAMVREEAGNRPQEDSKKQVYIHMKSTFSVFDLLCKEGQ